VLTTKVRWPLRVAGLAILAVWVNIRDDPADQEGEDQWTVESRPLDDPTMMAKVRTRN
jgi:hypothetical protein